jgi:hypothetical protein
MEEKKVPKTNAERQREWRERRKEKLGDNEYKKKERERIKEIYNKKKELKPVKEEIIDIPKLKPLKRRINPIIKNELKDKSKDIYIKFIKKFYKNYTDKELNENHDIIKAINNEKFIHKNVKEDFKFINEKIDDIIKKYHNVLYLVYAIFARIRGLTPFIKKIYPYVERLKDINQKKREDKIIENDKYEKISFEKEDIIKNLENNELKYDEKILYGLIFLLPPRRYNEYRITKIAKEKPNETNDVRYNYYYNGDIYIYNSKVDTRNILERENSKIRDIIKVPNEIDKIINKDHEYLLGKENGESNIGKKLKRITKKIYGEEYGIIEIRRIKISKENERGMDYKERRKMAKEMNHSIEQQSRYILTKREM